MQNLKQEGITLDFVESALNHPTHANGLVSAGDPVSVGKIVGVSKITAAATTDTVPVRTRGVFSLPVAGVGSAGNAAIAAGDALYFDPATGVVNANNTKTPFGRALAAVASGATTTIDVLLTGF